MMQFVNILHIKKNYHYRQEKENSINQWKTKRGCIIQIFFFVKKIINTPDDN